MNKMYKKSQANFWHRVSKEAGCPYSRVIFGIKCQSQSRFKYEVRRLKRREKHLHHKKLAAALGSKDSNTFWAQVRQINFNNSSPSSSVIDSTRGASNITNVFSAKLEALLNSCPTSPCNELLSSLVVNDEHLSSFSFTDERVASALSHLKPGKHDGSPP